MQIITSVIGLKFFLDAFYETDGAVAFLQTSFAP
jgi:hypothetical protein